MNNPKFPIKRLLKLQHEYLKFCDYAFLNHKELWFDAKPGVYGVNSLFLNIANKINDDKNTIVA